MDEHTRKRIKRRSAAQEGSVAGRYKGTRTPGSGSGFRIRGDVKTNHYLHECKTTLGKTQIVIKLADLKLIERRALGCDRVPVLTFDIGSARYHILTDADFAEITGADDDGGT